MSCRLRPWRKSDENRLRWVHLLVIFGDDHFKFSVFVRVDNCSSLFFYLAACWSFYINLRVSKIGDEPGCWGRVDNSCSPSGTQDLTSLPLDLTYFDNNSGSHNVADKLPNLRVNTNIHYFSFKLVMCMYIDTLSLGVGITYVVLDLYSNINICNHWVTHSVNIGYKNISFYVSLFNKNQASVSGLLELVKYLCLFVNLIKYQIKHLCCVVMAICTITRKYYVYMSALDSNQFVFLNWFQIDFKFISNWHCIGSRLTLHCVRAVVVVKCHTDLM
jgi:hypothetical protein